MKSGDRAEQIAEAGDLGLINLVEPVASLIFDPLVGQHAGPVNDPANGSEFGLQLQK